MKYSYTLTALALGMALSGTAGASSLQTPAEFSVPQAQQLAKKGSKAKSAKPKAAKSKKA